MFRLLMNPIRHTFVQSNCAPQLIAHMNVNLQLQFTRESTSFYTRTTAEQLWKGVTSVSNAGRRRGRGKGAGKKMAKDMNKGQIMGVGMKNMLWPGLNAPILRGKEVLQIRELEPDKQYMEKLVKLRDQMEKPPRMKTHSLERGWSGNKMAGKWIGPPDAIAGEEFVGFDTIVLVMKPVFCMKAQFGKTKRISVLTVTGNKNGIAGFAVGKARDSRNALKKSRNKSGQRLVHVPLHDGHTVIHDFHSRFDATEVFVRKRPKGYGLVAHRCIRGICQAIGITDLSAKVEGSQKNYLNLTRAFFIGLLKQKTFQQMANEKRLHVVELREDRDNYPVVVASPESGCRSESEIDKDESLDFSVFVHNGRLKETVPHKPMYYVANPGWQHFLKKWHVQRSREDARVELIAKHGALESFLTIRDKERIKAKKAALIQAKIKEEE